MPRKGSYGVSKQNEADRRTPFRRGKLHDPMLQPWRIAGVMMAARTSCQANSLQGCGVGFGVRAACMVPHVAASARDTYGRGHGCQHGVRHTPYGTFETKIYMPLLQLPYLEGLPSRPVLWSCKSNKEEEY